ncbi:MAG: PilZ domain-containing protein [Sphingomonas sp.]|uniref:PilZ domain-containing protein n=1 Tax=Sphingomonas sp. TaxID=28214 RepID=UPI001B2D9478|nr:PilZ domain-containing protein [Sphingomonas sp.]MBO9623716.1 PilZ domain-containing protein [Sphingomonas sp.]
MRLTEAGTTTDQGLPLDRPERIVTTLLVGKLLCVHTGERLCRIRNISTKGMAVETERPPSYGAWVTVELRSGERLQGTVVWSSSGRAGVEFAEPVEVERILAEAKANQSARMRSVVRAARTPRAPRFEVQCPARVINFGQSLDVVVENLSQSGAKVRVPQGLELDTQVVVSIAGLGARRAAVRWNRDDTAGLSFIEIIPYNDLAAWLGHLGTSN